jgi:K+-sensing histidine kinase KdpD
VKFFQGRAVPSVLGVAGPLAVAAAWIPLRRIYPDLDVALVLVLVVMAVGALGSVSAALAAAASASWWFDFFDTRPYAHPAIAGAPDLATFVVLAVVGASGGWVAARWTTQRRAGKAGGEDLLLLRNAAGLIATGDEPMEVLSGIVLEVQAVLRASNCEFSAEPAVDQLPAVLVGRDGSVAHRPPRPGTPWRLAVPVWAQGHVVGHVVAAGAAAFPAVDRLRIAITLADQAGSVLAACGMIPLPPDPPLAPRLRLVDSPLPGGPLSAGEVGPASAVVTDRLLARGA